MSKLQEMRKKRGVSQAALAEMSGVNLRTLQFYEQGLLDINNAKLAAVFSLAAALECDIEQILDDQATLDAIGRYYGMNTMVCCRDEEEEEEEEGEEEGKDEV